MANTTKQIEVYDFTPNKLFSTWPDISYVPGQLLILTQVGGTKDGGDYLYQVFCSDPIGAEDVSRGIEWLLTPGKRARKFGMYEEVDPSFAEQAKEKGVYQMLRKAWMTGDYCIGIFDDPKMLSDFVDEGRKLTDLDDPSRN